VCVALSRCTPAVVLCLDADEGLVPELAASIRKIFSDGEPAANGFSITAAHFIWGAGSARLVSEWRLRLARRKCRRMDRAANRITFERLRSNCAAGRRPAALFLSRSQDHLLRASNGRRMSLTERENVAQSFSVAGILFAPGIAFLKQLVINRAGAKAGAAGSSPA